MKLIPCLLVLITACRVLGAPSVVLYETGWEAAPANPAWTLGNLIPQNGWLSFPEGSNDRNKVVANGSADANPFGSPVTTPFGSQFHRWRASASTSAENDQFVWPDLSVAWAARPPDYDILMGSIDVFVPSGDSAVSSVYGLLGFDYDPSFDDFFLDYGFLIVPNTRSIRLIIDEEEAAESAPSLFPYDTWFNLSIQVNYSFGDVVVLYNGAPVPGLTANNFFIPGSSFLDLDLFCRNSTNTPTSRIIFSDNYRVAVNSPVPPNDNFADAMPLTGVSGQSVGFNIGGSAEPGEPDHALVPPTASVWYIWTASQTELFTFDTIGSAFNTVLAIYTGDALDLLNEVASNDDSAGSPRSRVLFLASEGTLYRIAVDGVTGEQGRLVLRWGPTPPNDDFISAQVLTGQSGSVTGTTDLATRELGEPNHAGFQEGNSIWYVWVAPATGAILLDTMGSQFDTLLAVYSGSELQSLTLEAANDDISFGNLRSRVPVNAVEGQEYRIAIDGSAGARGPTVLNWAPGGVPMIISPRPRC